MNALLAAPLAMSKWFPATLSSTVATTLLVLLAAVCLLWLVALWLRDVSIADPFWGAGFVLVAWTAWAQQESTSARGWLVLVLVTLWGLRLALFLLWRHWGKPEDYRYRAMRDAHGPRFWWVSLFTVFLLQGALLWFVALPLQVIVVSKTDLPLNWLDAIGVMLWCLGLVFEAVGDWQLASFKRDPANTGRVIDRGLWRYTRHPNYFGDFCVWWGLFAIAVAGGAWWTIASPLLMSVLLLYVSGVRLLETTIADRRPEYAEYRRRTSAFFPRPPRA